MKKKLLIILLAVQVILLLLYLIDTNRWATNDIKAAIGKFEDSKTLSERCVTSFGEDDKQQIWIGTTSGLNIYHGNSYKQLFCIPTDTNTIPDNKILSIAKDHKNRMWIGTPNGVACHVGWFKFKRYDIPFSMTGVYQIEKYDEDGVLANNGIAVYYIKENSIKEFYRFKEHHLTGNLIFPDKEQGFWIVTPKRVAHYNKDGKQTAPDLKYTANLTYANKQGDTIWFSQSHKVSAIDLSANKIIYTTKEELPIIPTALYPKDEHHVYLNSSFHGLYSLDTRSNELTKLTDNDFHLRHKDFTISAFFGDSEKNLWIGYQYGGFQVISLNNIAYENLNNKAVNNFTRGQTITCLEAVGNDIIGSTEAEVFYYQHEKDAYKHYLYKDIFSDSPYYRQTLEDVIPHADNKVWLISNVRILSCTLENGEINVDKRVFGPKHFGPLLGTGVKIGDEILVTSSSSYLLRSRFGADICDSIPVDNKLYGNESKLVRLANGNVLIVMKGLNMALYNPDNNRVVQLKINKPEGLNNADPTAAYCDSQKRIWIGTRHNGLTLYRPDTETLTSVTDFPLANIQSIHEDTKGLLWICSHDNLVSYYSKDKSVHFSSYPPSYNINGKSIYYRNSSMLPGGNTLICGTSDGCLTVPLTATTPRKHSNLNISALSIKKKDGTTEGINSDFADKKHFTFAHDENNIIIDFANVNYSNVEKVMYQYKLEGFDHDWSLPSLKGSAQYANLQPGNYTFKVRLMASQSLPTPSERTLKITIKSSFWTSMAAIYFYLLCVIGFIVYAQSIYLKAQKNKLKMEQLEKERLRDQQINEMNMSFFTNISHEFRNPLTLIAGPLLVLKSDETLSRSVRKTLNSVCVSVNRMLVLIDQMLDFNKLETDVLRLKVAEYDVVSKLKELTTLFGESAKLRNIEVTTQYKEENLYAWIDIDKIEKIMSNLLTNALKHTTDALKQVSQPSTGSSLPIFRR